MKRIEALYFGSAVDLPALRFDFIQKSASPREPHPRHIGIRGNSANAHVARQQILIDGQRL